MNNLYIIAEMDRSCDRNTTYHRMFTDKEKALAYAIDVAEETQTSTRFGRNSMLYDILKLNTITRTVTRKELVMVDGNLKFKEVDRKENK